MSRNQQNGAGPSQLNPMWDIAQSWNFSISENSGAGSGPKSEIKPPASCPPNPPNINKAEVQDGNRKKAAAAVGESDHDIHLWTERERRKKMKNMFSNLHALLPHVTPKADKSTIVDEAVNTIRSLELTLQQLEKKKAERMMGMEPPLSQLVALESQVMDARVNQSMLVDNSPPLITMPRISSQFSTYTWNNVVLNVSGEEAYISICTPKKPGLLSTIAYVMGKHNIEVVSADVSSNYFSFMCIIHAHYSAPPGPSDPLTETLMIEEIFRMTAAEMSMYLTA